MIDTRRLRQLAAVMPEIVVGDATAARAAGLILDPRRDYQPRGLAPRPTGRHPPQAAGSCPDHRQQHRRQPRSRLAAGHPQGCCLHSGKDNATITNRGHG